MWIPKRCGQLAAQVRRRRLERDQRAERVEQQRAAPESATSAHATNRQVANSAVNSPSRTASEASAAVVIRRRFTHPAPHMNSGNSTTS